MQNPEKVDFNSFISPQLRNPKKIKLIEKLQLFLDIEYDKFVHLKIKDPVGKRWELPEKEILDKEYLKNRYLNKVEMTRYSRIIDSHFFYLEILANNSTGIENYPEIDEHDYDFRYNGFINETLEDFSFKLMTHEGEEFYYFTSKKNFLFSDKYINFESKLTTDKIYGFGERTHDFKLKDGTYIFGIMIVEIKNMMMEKEE